MHIEPGLVDTAKIGLSYTTGAASFAIIGKMLLTAARQGEHIPLLVIRSLACTILVFSFFEILPHSSVGVSEVHLIFGTTLFLICGAGPAAFGLALGLLVQGLFFAPYDLPQYGMNVTTLIMPLAAVALLGAKLIPAQTAYRDISYAQALGLSTAYQAGIVGWVAFWALYGQGFSLANLASIGSFGVAYMAVMIIEPLLDLAVLAMAKNFPHPLVQRRVSFGA